MELSRNDEDRSPNFKFQMKPPQACVHCHIHEDFGFPHSIYHGELVPVIFGLSNTGSLPASNIALRLNLPQLMCVSTLNGEQIRRLSGFSKETGNSYDLIMKWLDDVKILDPIKVEETMTSETPSSSRSDANKNNKSYEEEIIALNQILKPGEMTCLVLWLQGDMIGDFLLQLVIGYNTLHHFTAGNDHAHQTQYNAHQAPDRVLCLSRQLLVEPLLNMSLFTRNHFGDVGQYILGVEIENICNDVLKFPGKANDLTGFDLLDTLEHESSGGTSRRGIDEAGNEQLQTFLFSDSASASTSSLALVRHHRYLSILSNAIDSEVANEEKRNALRTLSESEKSPWIVIKHITCLAAHWRIQTLIEHEKLKPVKGLSNSVVFLKLLPVEKDSDFEHQTFTLDKEYTISLQDFDVQKEEEIAFSHLTPLVAQQRAKLHGNEKENEVVKKVLGSSKGIVHEFVKKKFLRWLERIQQISKGMLCCTLHDNELEIVIAFEITESPRISNYLDTLTSQQSLSSSSSLESPLVSQTTTVSVSTNINNKGDNVLEDHPLDMASKPYTDTTETLPSKVSDGEANSTSTATGQPPLITLPPPLRPAGKIGHSNDDNADVQRINQFSKEQMDVKINEDLAHLPKILRQKRYGFHFSNEPFVFSQVEGHTGCPLRVAIKYPKTLPMTSKNEKVSCDVQLMVLNISRKECVSFTFETLAQNEEFDNKLS
ncbi:hypothetical protein RFI_22764 [Reticulomyxa filosa]|uniref:Uncharacterized protein n=1 Tax=Reticulomyxa filosa TaxID=46433 RepID=X6MKR1_RETFI|nr:hypothetical protein RFI_22764 [Reticulomyxa filosa]|eukprot:ETO14603.1 hypothetical protein RFI_22764 [Reticulomyxa filosa]